MNFELLELLGIGYVIDHCVSFFHKKSEEKAYKVYVTDVLRLTLENTAKQTQGSYIEKRFADFLELQENISEDDGKSEEEMAEEVISDIRNKLGRL